MSLRLMSAVLSSTSNSKVKRESSTEAESARLLKQLLECVQQCQKRYGGRKELATEFDNYVVALCLTLEAVLQHGLKNSSSALNLVTNSLHFTNDSPSFWRFIYGNLTRHEQERYHCLKHIWTDCGRGRAWIRSTLNERSLERYFHTLLANTNSLQEHYDSWAILRDPDKSSMLPNMAAGLGAILFAISIDKPEFNSAVLQRIDAVKPRTEPIIEAPIPEKVNRAKTKKNKVARQYISFDDDDTNMLSTSVPSSSGSLSSDSNTDNQSSKSVSQLEEIVEEHHHNQSPSSPTPLRPVSAQIGALRPMSLDVGELRPVSVEIGDKSSLSELDEESTDISALMTSLELRDKDELNKKQHRIDALERENEVLKEQVRKYIGAIRMLKRDGDNGLLPQTDGLDDEGGPDYRSEAKLFERKLVQVADMHAELMDFNVALQKSLCQKEALVEKLNRQLETLDVRPNEAENPQGNVNVWIPSAFLTGTGSQSHHVYQIFIKTGTEEWNIYRRYAQFHALHKDLMKLDAAVSGFNFPPKKSIRNKVLGQDSEQVEKRRQRLQTYLRKVIAHWPELANCNSRQLLEQHLAFFKDDKDDSQKNKSIFNTKRNTSDDYTGL